MPGEGEAKRDWFGKNAVAAAHHRRLRVLPGPSRKRREQRVASREEHIRGISQQDRERRIEDVARRHAAVKPAGLDARELLDVRQKRDDVVFRRPLDLVDAGGRKLQSFGAEARGGTGGDDPCFLHALAGGELHVQPNGKSAKSAGV
jgi:hypothetical protein